MKEEFKNYLREINKTEPIIEHIEKIYTESTKLLDDEEIVDIFVNEVFDKENIKTDTSLVFFTDKSVMEAKNFILFDRDLDYVNFTNKIVYYSVKYKDFDLKEAIVNSWLQIYVKFSSDIRLELSAIGKNCEYAINLLNKYIKPNVIL